MRPACKTSQKRVGECAREAAHHLRLRRRRAGRRRRKQRWWRRRVHLEKASCCPKWNKTLLRCVRVERPASAARAGAARLRKAASSNARDAACELLNKMQQRMRPLLAKSITHRARLKCKVAFSSSPSSSSGRVVNATKHKERENGWTLPTTYPVQLRAPRAVHSRFVSSSKVCYTSWRLKKRRGAPRSGASAHAAPARRAALRRAAAPPARPGARQQRALSRPRRPP